MMSFINDNVIVIVRRKALPQRLGVQCLHRNEEIIQVFRLMVPYPQFAKVGVLQHALEGQQALF